MGVEVLSHGPVTSVNIERLNDTANTLTSYRTNEVIKILLVYADVDGFSGHGDARLLEEAALDLSPTLGLGGKTL